MLIKDTTVIKDIKAGITQVPELSRYILRTFPITEIVDELAAYIIDDCQRGAKPIVITATEFETHFRIAGLKKDENGNYIQENRGRKVGTRIVDGKAVLPDD